MRQAQQPHTTLTVPAHRDLAFSLSYFLSEFLLLLLQYFLSQLLNFLLFFKVIFLFISWPF